MAYEEFREAWFTGKRPDPREFYEKYPRCMPELRERIENFLFVAAGLPMANPEGLGERTGIAGRVLGDFRILREIGRGGMGVVYEAEQLSLNRKVALKILSSHLSISGESIRKFKREAEAGGRQAHPGIVTVFAVGDHDGFHYIAQELVEGGFTLEDKLRGLREGGGAPEGYFREAAKLIAEVADALHHAHQTGVIHRDVKPSNILLGGDGRPKVTDFGLARVEGALALSRTGDFAGTPYYMSPEQIASRSDGIDARSDVYSLGVTFYEMLTFRKPFEGESCYEVLKKIPLADPVHPQKVNPRVPGDLAVVCLKAMEKEPQKRYPSMKEFADDLKRFLNGEVILARPAGAAERWMKRIRRNPVLSTAVGAVLLVLVVLAGFMIWSFIRDKIRLEEISRLSDLNLIYRLQVQAETLWPAYPERALDMETWLREARGLAGRLEEHRSMLQVLAGKDGLDEKEAALRDRLAALVSGIEALKDEETGLIADVEKRFQRAVTVVSDSIEKHREEWDRAVASIADKRECPIYRGLVIRPQVGFVPLGPDPDSGLWEFAHLQTGEIAKRGEDGRIAPFEGMGMVFVLIPGGTFMMGAQEPSEEAPLGSPNVDPLAGPFEYRPHEVTVQPFLMSKYEMTQGQWVRIAGENPSVFPFDDPESKGEITPLNPVDNVSWEDCMELLPKVKLRLPRESEWEYAARAGTTTVWYTGNERETLKGAANLRDSYNKEHGGDHAWEYDLWLNDGYFFTAPVGSFRPNAFGLHDVIGNLWEWCLDVEGESVMESAGGAAEAVVESSRRINRGGSWFQVAGGSTIADRNGDSKKGRCDFVGVRTAASLQAE